MSDCELWFLSFDCKFLIVSSDYKSDFKKDYCVNDFEF